MGIWGGSRLGWRRSLATLQASTPKSVSSIQIFFLLKAVILKEHIMIPMWDLVVGTWTHDKKVDFPQPGSPKRSIVTVVSASRDSDSAILVE